MHAFRWNWWNWHERNRRSPFEPRIRVSGSDLREGPATERLARLGATIHIGHRESNIEGSEVVVVSSAIDRTNPEVASALAARIPVIREHRCLLN